MIILSEVAFVGKMFTTGTLTNEQFRQKLDSNNLSPELRERLRTYEFTKKCRSDADRRDRLLSILWALNCRMFAMRFYERFRGYWRILLRSARQVVLICALLGIFVSIAAKHGSALELVGSA